MAALLDVAKYILERQGPVTTLKLQKLVYYAQAWSVARGQPLFDEQVKAWVQGPVVPALWHHFKKRRQATAADISSGGGGLTDAERETVDRVLGYYGGLPPSYLSKLTHHERPWQEARASGAERGHQSPAITTAALRSFYGGRTPEELEADFQMTLAGEVMDQHRQCLARLAL